MNNTSTNHPVDLFPYHSTYEWFKAGIKANQTKMKQFTLINAPLPKKYIIAFAIGFFIKLLFFGILFMIVFRSLNGLWAK